MTNWEKCVAFHGHSCGGLSIGYRAAEYAMELLQVGFSDNEQVVCIAENDACGVDAIQVLLGCSIGKGNLLFHMTGKQAFSFYNRATGRSVRLVLKPKPAGLTGGVLPLLPGKQAAGSVPGEGNHDSAAHGGEDLRFLRLRLLRGKDRRQLDPAGWREKAVPGLLRNLQPV